MPRRNTRDGLTNQETLGLLPEWSPELKRSNPARELRSPEPGYWDIPVGGYDPSVAVIESGPRRKRASAHIPEVIREPEGAYWAIRGTAFQRRIAEIHGGIGYAKRAWQPATAK